MRKKQANISQFSSIRFYYQQQQPFFIMGLTTKIIYFDDEPFVADGLASSLKSLYNIESIVVHRIDELFDHLANNNFDLIILDIMAPVPNNDSTHIHFSQEDIAEMEGGLYTGLVLFKKIRAISRYKDTPIIFVTAHSVRSTENLIDPKITHLRKPILCRDLYKKITEFGL